MFNPFHPHMYQNKYSIWQKVLLIIRACVLSAGSQEKKYYLCLEHLDKPNKENNI